MLDRRGPLPLQPELVESVRGVAGPFATYAHLIAGRSKRWFGELDEAQAEFTAAFADAEARGLDDPASTACLGLCALAQQAGDYAKAFAHAERALEMTRGSKTASEAHALSWCGFCAQFLNRPEDARQYLDEARIVARFVGNPTAIATAAKMIGPLHTRFGEFEAAREALLEAVELSRALGNRRGEVGILFDLSQLDLSLEEPVRALEHVDTAVELAEALGAPQYEGVLFFARGEALFDLGRLTEAAAQYDSALGRLGTHTIPSVSVRALSQLGAIAAIGGDQVGARAQFALAEEVIGEADMPIEQALLDLRRNYLSLEDGSDLAALESRLDSENEEVQRAAKDLLRRVRSAGRTNPDLRVGKDGRSFTFRDAEPVDITRRKALRGILLALVDLHSRAPGTSLTVEQTIEAGWPGEIITWEAAARRVYSTVNRLRDLGLGELLVTTDDGYMLEPGIVVDRSPTG